MRTAPDLLQSAFGQLRKTLRAAEDAGYDVSRIYLMLDEILSNIYKHGYRRRNGEPIGVQVRVAGDRCEITTRDLAPVFDSAHSARTRKLPDPETGSPGGRGLVIVDRLCESFSHTPIPGGGNELRLALKLVLRRKRSVASRPRKATKTRG